MFYSTASLPWFSWVFSFEIASANYFNILQQVYYWDKMPIDVLGWVSHSCMRHKITARIYCSSLSNCKYFISQYNAQTWKYDHTSSLGKPSNISYFSTLLNENPRSCIIVLLLLMIIIHSTRYKLWEFYLSFKFI